MHASWVNTKGKIGNSGRCHDLKLLRILVIYYIYVYIGPPIAYYTVHILFIGASRHGTQPSRQDVQHPTWPDVTFNLICIHALGKYSQSQVNSWLDPIIQVTFYRTPQFASFISIYIRYYTYKDYMESACKRTNIYERQDSWSPRRKVNRYRLESS